MDAVGESVGQHLPMNTASVSGNRIVHRARTFVPDGFPKVECACEQSALSTWSIPASRLNGSVASDPPYSGKVGAVPRRALTTSVSSIRTLPWPQTRNGCNVGKPRVPVPGLSLFLLSLGGGIPQSVPRGHEGVVFGRAGDIPDNGTGATAGTLDVLPTDVVVRGAMRRRNTKLSAVGLLRPHGPPTLHQSRGVLWTLMAIRRRPS